MNPAIRIIKAVLVIILTIVIIGIVVVRIASSTILDKAYIINSLQANNYYNNIYEELKSNFENYIGPSGLDENILNDICTAEDIKKDTEIIINNIYEGTEKKVNTNEITKRVKEKINKAVSEKESIITSKMQASINKYSEVIAEEYINTISHTEYEETLNDIYIKVSIIMELAQKVLFTCLVVTVVLLVVLNIKTIYNIASNIGIALFSSGAFFIISNYRINSKIKIEQIKILNNSISNILQKIILDILGKVNQTGWIIITIGAILIIIGSIFKIIKTEENSKKERK